MNTEGTPAYNLRSRPGQTPAPGNKSTKEVAIYDESTIRVTDTGAESTRLEITTQEVIESPISTVGHGETEDSESVGTTPLLSPCTDTERQIQDITSRKEMLEQSIIENRPTVYNYRNGQPLSVGTNFIPRTNLLNTNPELAEANVVGKRSVMVLLGALLVYVGAKEFGMAPGGPLGTVATGVSVAFVLGAQGWGEGKNPLVPIVSEVWDVLEGALFAFVGAEVDVYRTSLHDLLMAIAIMVVTMIVRLLVFAIIMVLRKQFTKGEILVGMLVWFPKATVLAALSPQVLDNIRRTRGDPLHEDSDEFRMGRLVLLGSVVEMLVTTPIGYLLLKYLGERLLPKDKADKEASAGLTVASKL